MMRKIVPLMIGYALIGMAAAGPAFAQASEPFLGEIITVPFGFCPTGWMALNGQLLSIADNDALYQLLGTNYGGNGTTNFALPTAKPAFTATGVQLTQCIWLLGVFPSKT